jgi:hypothetical protein
MVCYVCDKPASGQCRECRRFFCKNHLGGEVGCAECFASRIRENDARGRAEDAAERERNAPATPSQKIGATLVVAISLVGLYSCYQLRGGPLRSFGVLGLVVWGVIGVLFLLVVLEKDQKE